RRSGQLFFFRPIGAAILRTMTDPADPLTPATPDELASALAYALRFNGRKRTHDADEIMAEIVVWSSIWSATDFVMKRLLRSAPTEFTQVLFATLFMELRGGLERRRRLVAMAEGREIECPGPALSSALTSCAFVSFVVKAL